MRKTLLIICIVLMSFFVNAQCPLKEAVDFSAKDYDGNDINLFEILDRGQYVLINFFCTTSEQCQKIVPNVVEAYKAMGSNKHDVFFMEISSADNSYAIEQWVASYGVEYPTIYPTSGGTHGGDAIYNMYQIPFYPVLILIAPDREIVIQDLWPVTSSQSIIDALVAFDIEKPETPKDTDYRNVIIEEFTGRDCGNCPAGHRVANQIAASNPGRVFPINIHAGKYSPTTYPNLNTEDGNTILSGFDVPGYPTGNVNRTSMTAIGREKWSSQSNKQLEQLAEVLVDGQVEIDKDARVAEIKVNLSYVLDTVPNTNYLPVMLLRAFLRGSQSEGASNPDQYADGQYCHMHVLRDVVTSTWGDKISNITSGSKITKTYTYEIPEVIGSPNGVEVDLDNIYFLAVVTEKYQGVPTCPVLNVNKLQNVINSDEDPENPEEPITLSAPKNVDASPASTSSIIVKWDAVESALSYNIYRDGSFIANVTNLSYADKDLKNNTEYCYMVTSCHDDMESDLSERVCAKTLGEGIEECKNNFKIYPNPVNDRLYIETVTEFEEVEIYNIVGVMLGQWTMDNGHHTMSLDISDLNAGVYFVKIKTNDNEVVNRIVKQ